MEYTKDQLDLRTKPSVADGIVLDRGHSVHARIVDYQPGNSTRYFFSFVSTKDFSDDTNEKLGFRGHGWIVTDLNNLRSMLISIWPGIIHYNYVQEKLGCSISDAYVLAELFAYLLDLHELNAG